MTNRTKAPAVWMEINCCVGVAMVTGLVALTSEGTSMQSRYHVWELHGQDDLDWFTSAAQPWSMCTSIVTEHQHVRFLQQLQENAWLLTDSLKADTAASGTLAYPQTILQGAHQHGQPWQAEPVLRGLPRSTRTEDFMKPAISGTDLLAASTGAEALRLLQVFAWLPACGLCSCEQAAGCVRIISIRLPSPCRILKDARQCCPAREAARVKHNNPMKLPPYRHNVDDLLMTLSS